MDFPILGQLRPNFEVGRLCDQADNYGTTKYGWRKSGHKGWLQCRPEDVGDANDWATEAEMFLRQLGYCASKSQVRVCAVSKKGKLKKEYFFEPDDDWINANKLRELMPEKHNIMFDPVLWKNSKRSKSSRLGFATVSGAHPFELFPEPVIFWAIGVNAYQLLLPWHEELTLKQNERRIKEQDFGTDCNKFFPLDDLMHLPGSLIHRPNMPPMTAAVLYDAFSVTDVEDTESLWSQY